MYNLQYFKTKTNKKHLPIRRQSRYSSASQSLGNIPRRLTALPRWMVEDEMVQGCLRTLCPTHNKNLPIFWGSNDIQSGLLPLSRTKQLGSNMAGTPAEARVGRIISLIFL